MGIRLIAGRSGSGKSTYIYEQVVKAAADDPKQSYFVIVPDQFTMQTQLDMVNASACKGILNIEVLSFSRLAHRVFEETGGNRCPVLDDTGKNLILRRCAIEVKDEIPYLAGKLNKPGYIHEVKSAISEFMQYGINNDCMHTLIEYADKGNKITLKKKLMDLSVIYEHFKEYIKERYITSEETHNILSRDIYRCHLLKDSIVIFDGFTGFTPIQNDVLESLVDVCKDVIFTLNVDPGILTTGSVNGNDIFSFSYKSFASLTELAKKHMEVIRVEEIEPGKRYADSAELSFLEEHLLRNDGAVYDNECTDIHMDSYHGIRDDVRGLATHIRELVREKNICYRDIAVITGNLEAYAGEIEDVLEEYGIPYYLDRNRGIVLNPFVEFIKSALDIYTRDFNYETVFRYLRTGFCGISNEDVDMLDDYVTAAGIRGNSIYSHLFCKKTSVVSPEEAEAVREKFMDSLAPFADAGIKFGGTYSASLYVKTLYDFIVKNDCAAKLDAYSEMFKEQGDHSKALEYSQIYRHTMHLLEQIHDLLADEQMDIAEFLKLMEAGFSEIELGTIPQSVDRVIIGDMERTRLKPVKYLFFMGLNDGWIPGSVAKGGIISDGDREYLTGCDIELAPSPRNKIYIDRFYLYMNLTKPSQGLYLSYVTVDNEFKALRASYMVSHIKKLFPKLVDAAHSHDDISAVESIKEARELYASYMRQYADGCLPDDKKHDLYRLHAVVSDDADFADRIFENAYMRFAHKTLDDRLAAVLYGSRLYASVSRMETYAKCAYSYFLKYGLKLKEREKYGIEASDMGSIYHGVLEIFIDMLKERGLDWFSFSKEDAKELVDEAVDKMAAIYTDAVLFESEQNKYIVGRMKDVMLRTVMMLSYHLKKGDFVPYAYEYEFDGGIKSAKTDIRLSGKIDRVDIKEDADKVYVKITDYKSGAKDFSLMCFYKGLQLQMVVYMNRIAHDLKEKYPEKEIVPAAMLYYHIDDPLVESSGAESDEDIDRKIKKALRNKGIIDNDEEVIKSLDNDSESDSDIIMVKRGRDGQPGGSGLFDREDMAVLSQYADHKLMELADRMASGDINIDPKEVYRGDTVKQMDSCEYCEYKTVCGFDVHMSGCEKEIYREKGSTAASSGISHEELLEGMKKELNGTE